MYAVGKLVESIGLPQSAVSKHLAVLRSVGVLSMSKRGQHRMYQLNAQKLKPIYDWVKTFDRFWTQQLDRIKDRAEQRARRNSSH